ncbi:MAG: SWIM zinc finger family protein [Actinomycetes bacterium]
MRGMSPSRPRNALDQGSVVFGTDQGRDPVFLNCEVIPSQEFAQMMLVLGSVVRSNFNPRPVDHSDYQRWVQGQYLAELAAGPHSNLIVATTKLRASQQALSDRVVQLRNQVRQLDSEVQRLATPVKVAKARRKFWDWLYNADRDAWIVLDPIVSVQSANTYFEAFSEDESSYVRVNLPHSEIKADQDIVRGTTNIDFSVALEREFARIRTYRPLRLRVGVNSVSVATRDSEALEEKIDLPDSWVNGLVEVQAALTIVPASFKISAQTLAAIIGKLARHSDKEGPRSIIFDLQPGEPIRIMLEPWSWEIVESDHIYQGRQPQRIRIWGRRRLVLLEPLLHEVQDVDVSLLGSGMPSFWSVKVAGMELLLGLSGWSRLDWAAKARFSGFRPRGTISQADLVLAEEVLAELEVSDPETFASQLDIDLPSARATLNSLCAAGKALFDPTSGAYSHRVLFPDWSQSDDEAGLEERIGYEIFRSGGVRIFADEMVNAVAVFDAHCSEANKTQTFTVNLQLDADSRVSYAQCSCPNFRFHKLRKGPCRHIVATLIKVSDAQ